jgi:hypothetical protein
MLLSFLVRLLKFPPEDEAPQVQGEREGANPTVKV